MNTILSKPTIIADLDCAPSELDPFEVWNSAAISELIRSKSTMGEGPAFLFLGRHETGALRNHLEGTFGEGTVPIIRGTYYMGLEVVEIDVDSYVRVAGRKTNRTLQDPIARRPAWRDQAVDSLWSLRID